ISLWQGKDSFRGDSSLRSWVYRVSMNTCISYKRKKRVKTVPLEFSSDSVAPGSPGSRQARMLHDRISRLEPFDRAIVLLWLEDMSYDEIAAIVGISAKAVGVRLVRIKEKLKSL
ncbi:MAG: sigma-70 family RNA polymerase sigma factor, partial [Muribaculaceae bacterium]|nr:sigma-70 family RNA polymerase sigma factor [Muribaculaceae bacterium]